MSENPAAASPAATIIIVAWRLVDEFRECLDALAESVDAPDFEVIVVLNGAPDATAAIAASHPVVNRVITRYANIGFGAACNLAAHYATGKNLVFLNDDTLVDPLWLKSLVAASELGSNRGAVASLLLNFDGSVQEAGSRLLSHGGTMQWGRGLDIKSAELAPLLEPRAIDYGSAAALLVRRTAFEQIGGFDPLFEPAYFEDVDMQLRLRELGLEVWFEPSAQVLHHSGLSTRSDRWFKQFAANRSGYRFIERWSHVLVSAPTTEDASDVLSVIPTRSRARRPMVASEVDDSAAIALKTAAEYQEWLGAQLDQLSELHLEMAANPFAPTRKEILDINHELKTRVEDLEARGPVGVVKMRLGVWLTQKKQQSRDRRESPINPYE